MTLQVLGDDPKPPPRYTCECKNGATPVTLYGMCLCGECPKVDAPIQSYAEDCKSEKQTDFGLALEKYCKKEENKEDCPFFDDFRKKEGGEHIEDTFKKCKDVFDSILDDCENEKECCFILDDPNAPADD